VAFFAVAGLLFVVGLFLRAGQYFGQPDVEPTAPVTVAAPPPSAPAVTPAVEPTESVAKTPPSAQESATAPNEQAKQTGEAVEQTEQAEQTGEAGEAVEQTEKAEQADEAVEHAEQSERPGSDMILVSRQPIEVRASPSSSAPVMYGFPAGRSFRVIGHDGGFAQIKDLKSGASGWIDEAALAPPPRAPAVSAPSRRKPVSRKAAKPPADSKPKATTADSEAATEPVQTRRQPGLFGGLFGGIFDN
jgi:hypothetical protein